MTQVTTHNLGFPRIGARRELKQALEAYWRGESERAELEAVGAHLRQRHWALQADAGIDLLPVGDFSWYDHVLDLSLMLGVIPERFGVGADADDLDLAFRMARGRAHPDDPLAARACEMTKWFDTNYHYLVPEFETDQRFTLQAERLCAQVRQACDLGHRVKAVVVGPLSFLWLGKTNSGGERLALLENLLPIYRELLLQLRDAGAEWVQIDEPILALDLPLEWRSAFERAYFSLQVSGLKRMVAIYFDTAGDNLALACALPVEGLHLDLVRAPQMLLAALDRLPPYKVLSLGVVDGRNVWRTDLAATLDMLGPVHERLGERLWLAPSCSLLHVPVDLEQENDLDPELKTWLAFARQKLDEIAVLARALSHGRQTVAAALSASGNAIQSRLTSAYVHRAEVRARCEQLPREFDRRQPDYAARAPLQHERLRLPLLPSTTIGSFPQTAEIRAARHAWRRGDLDDATYRRHMEAAVADSIERQLEWGLDVLVHGEPERNDMVEYFAEQIDGFAFTRHGWVQSYGSRYVKPPILFGDVRRAQPMTVSWSQYAQSLTDRPVKGMLTGPVTVLQWSFVRDDQTRAETCLQLALALREEVLDLERAGLAIIQIDEPALREGLPLRQQEWKNYLDWAVRCFRITTSGVRAETQIHTHMCYAEFNDIIEAVAAMDADVVTLEASRSNMELLEAFREFDYPAEVGPGLYDIHSPNAPTVEALTARLEKALEYLPAERLWVNPDCGLKTRTWAEVGTALRAMTAAARRARAGLKIDATVA